MKVTTDACLFGAWAADHIAAQPEDPQNILDIGTGTGLLSLMAAQRNACLIDAVEIDQDACEQARENIEASPWPRQIQIFHTDIAAFAAKQLYDVIISNPPFYENELTSDRHKKNVAHHHAGLLLADLLKYIRLNLSPNGRFYLLLPYKRNAETTSLLQGAGLAALHITLVRQSTKHDFFRVMLCGTHERDNEMSLSNEISIVDDAGVYTHDFQVLLKDYYLREW